MKLLTAQNNRTNVCVYKLKDHANCLDDYNRLNILLLLLIYCFITSSLFSLIFKCNIKADSTKITQVFWFVYLQYLPHLSPVFFLYSFSVLQIAWLLCDCLVSIAKINKFPALNNFNEISVTEHSEKNWLQQMISTYVCMLCMSMVVSSFYFRFQLNKKNLNAWKNWDVSFGNDFYVLFVRFNVTQIHIIFFLVDVVCVTVI